MSEVIVFGDVEQVLTDWLTTQLGTRGHTIPVGTRVPSPRPGSFIRLIRTGGGPGAVFVLDDATVTFEAWAARESGALTLIQLVRGLVNSLSGQTVGGVTFYRIGEFGGPANLPDPDSAQTRYTYTASLQFRGTAT